MVGPRMEGSWMGLLEAAELGKPIVKVVMASDKQFTVLAAVS